MQTWLRQAEFKCLVVVDNGIDKSIMLSPLLKVTLTEFTIYSSKRRLVSEEIKVAVPTLNTSLPKRVDLWHHVLAPAPRHLSPAFYL